MSHPTPGSLAAAIADYCTFHALRGSSERHQQDVHRMLLAFAESTGGSTPVADVTRGHCEGFLRGYQERGCKPATQKAYHRVVAAFFRWLVDEERVAASPMQRVPKPQLPKEQVKPLTPDELARLLAQPDRSRFTGVRDVAFIAFLADTGLRISEAITIRMCQIDPRRRAVSVMGKGKKERTVFYGEAVVKLIRAYLERRGEVGGEDLLWVNSLGEPLLRFALTKRIQTYGRKAGIDGKRVSAHTLRHTFGVSWCVNGGDAFSLQRLLGHSTSQMTARYVDFSTGDLANLHRMLSPLDRLPQVSSGLAQQRRRRLI